jgi:uncharacterized damage-inducible protein DinB
MDPIAAAALQSARDQARAFDSLLEGLDEDAINWRPGEDTNSIAVLAVHAWGAAQAWTARAAGREIERDRASEFRAVATPEEVRALIGRAVEQVEQHLAAVDPSRYGEPWESPGGDLRLTRAECLLHALEHTREHLGQALLTRQLWDQRPASG